MCFECKFVTNEVIQCVMLVQYILVAVSGGFCQSNFDLKVYNKCSRI